MVLEALMVDYGGVVMKKTRSGWFFAALSFSLVFLQHMSNAGNLRFTRNRPDKPSWNEQINYCWVRRIIVEQCKG